MIRSHRICLKPTAEQESLFLQHAGFARFAYNWAVGEFKAGLDVGEWLSERTLRPRWNKVKGMIAPWARPLSQNPAKYAIIDFGQAADTWGAWRARLLRQENRRAGGVVSHGSSAASTSRASVPTTDRTPFAWTARPWCCRRSAAWPWSRSCAGRLDPRGHHQPDRRHVVCQLRRRGRPAGPAGERRSHHRSGRWSRHAGRVFNGLQVENPKALKAALRRLRQVDKAIARSRTAHGRSNHSNRRERLYDKRRRIHARIVNVRSDNHHKATTAIAKCAGRVVVETLNVSGMLRNRRLARSIADAGMSGFLAKLEYKCAWYGAEYIKADRWCASSKLCSHCGWKNDDLTLSDREWRCGGCGVLNERDANAAMNLANWPGLSFPAPGRGDRVRPAPPAVACEASRTSGEDPGTPPKLEYQIPSDF